MVSYLGSVLSEPWFPFGPPVESARSCLDFSDRTAGETIGPDWVEDGVQLSVPEPLTVLSSGDELGIPLGGLALTVTFGGLGSVGA